MNCPLLMYDPDSCVVLESMTKVYIYSDEGEDSMNEVVQR